MGACSFGSKAGYDVYTRSASLSKALGLLSREQNISDFGNATQQVLNLLQELRELYILDESNVDECINMFLKGINKTSLIIDKNRVRLPELLPKLFNNDYLKKILIGTEAVSVPEVIEETNYNRALEGGHYKQRIRDLRELFLNNIYGTSLTARDKMIREATDKLFQAIVINAGGITGKGISRGVVKSQQLLNANLRAYLNMLLNDLFKFLVQDGFNFDSVPNLDRWTKDIIDKFMSGTEIDLFKRKGVIKGSDLYARLYPILTNYFEDSSRFSPEHLDNLVKVSKSALYFTDRLKAEDTLRAFNNYVILNNFDNVINSIQGNRILIDPTYRDLYTSQNKYSLNSKGDGLNNNISLNDEVIIEDNLDPLITTGIERLPLVKRSNPLEAIGTLTVPYFTSVITKIKESALNAQTYEIDCAKFVREHGNTLTKEALEYFLEHKNLADAILDIRDNPVENTLPVLEIINNPIFQDTYLWYLNGMLIPMQLDILYSIYLGIFNPNNSNSYYSINRQSNGDFYSYFALVIDSIFAVDLCSIKKNDLGIWVTLKYYNEVFSRINRILETQTDAALARSLNSVYKNGLETYDINKVASEFNNYQYSVTKDNIGNDIHTLQFSLKGGNSVYTFLYNLSENSFSFSGMPTQEAVLKQDEQLLLKFIDSSLGTTLSRNREWRDAYFLGMPYVSSMEDLLKYAIRARALLAYSYAHPEINSPEKVTPSNLPGLHAKLVEGLKFNYTLNEIGKTSYLDTATLKRLVAAKAYVEKANVGSLILDSLRHGLSTQSFSKIDGSYGYLFLKIKLNVDNPYSSSIIMNPRIFKGLLYLKEAYDYSGNLKNSQQLNVAEFLENTLINYVSGVSAEGHSNVMQHGDISLLPSVNSDKPVILNMVINLHSNLVADLNGHIPSYLHTDLPAGEFVLGNVRLPDFCRLSLYRLLTYKDGLNDWVLRDKDGNESLRIKYDMPTLIKLEMTNIHAKTIMNILRTLNLLDSTVKQEAIKQVLSTINVSDVSQLSKKYLDLLKGLTLKGLYIVNYKHFNDACSELGISPETIIKRAILTYNLNHRLNPIKFTDSMHGWFSGGKVHANEVLLAYLYRYMSKDVYRLSLYQRLLELRDPNSSQNHRWISELFKVGMSGAYESYLLYEDLMDTIQQAVGKELHTFEQYDDLKKHQMLEDLVQSNFKLITNNVEFREKVQGKELSKTTNFFNKHYNEWVDPNTLYLILAKVLHDGKVYSITSLYDLVSLYSNINYRDLLRLDKMILNPVLDLLNLLDLLMTEEWQGASVGTLLAQPKNKGSIEKLEADKNNARNKRNVLHTASMQEIILNHRNGISEYYNVAAVEDLMDICHNSSGKTEDLVDVFNACTFSNLFIPYLENYSLGSNAAGVTKKTFTSAYDLDCGNTVIIKTAEFGLTNNWIYGSKFLLKLNKKMIDHVWLDKNGNEAVVNIFNSYKKGNILYGPQYYRKGNDYYRIELEKLDLNTFNKLSEENKLSFLASRGKTDASLLTKLDFNNQYIRNSIKVSVSNANYEQGNFVDRSQVTKNLMQLGNEQILEVLLINTNYKLWNAFGGMYSMEEAPDGHLVRSENSVKAVILAMNETYCENDTVDPNALSLKNYWQPLKHADIHYVCSTEAIKHGVANVNSADVYTNDEALSFFRIRMTQHGIQLDKEHYADDSEVSLMTLVISACAAKGYSFDLAVNLYKGLANLASLGVIDIQLAFNSFIASKYTDAGELTDTNWDTEFTGLVAKEVIKSLALKNITSDNVITRIADLLWRQLKDTADSKEFANAQLPYSDTAVYNQLLSAINIVLTKSGIKSVVDGTLAVMTPSFNIELLHGDISRDMLENNKWGISPEEALERFLKMELYAPTVYNNGSFIAEQGLERSNGIFLDKLLMGRTYNIKRKGTKGELKFNVHDVYTLNELLDLIVDGKLDYVYEDIITPRELRTYSVFFKNLAGELFLFWNLDSVKDLYKMSNLKDKLDGFYKSMDSNHKEGFARVVLSLALNNWNVESLRIKGNSTYRYVGLRDGIPGITDKTIDTWVNLLQDIREIGDKYEADTFTLDGILKMSTPDNVTSYLKNYIQSLQTYCKRVHQRDLVAISKESSESNLQKIETAISSYLEALASIGDKTDQQSLLDKLQVNKRLILIANYLLLQGDISTLTGDMLNISQSTYRLLKKAGLDIVEQELGKLTFRQENLLDFLRLLFTYYDKVSIKGLLHNVDRESIKIDAYGVKMPKTAASSFGLNKYDTVLSILEDKEFFYKRLVAHYNDGIIDDRNYTVTLKAINGDHYYIFDNTLGLLPLNLVKSTLDFRTSEGGHVYRTDGNGNVRYEIFAGDQIYTDTVSGKEIIVTNNLKFYLDNLDYRYVNITENGQIQNKVKLLKDFIESNSRTSHNYISKILSYPDVNGTVKKAFITKNHLLGFRVINLFSPDQIKGNGVATVDVEIKRNDFLDEFLQSYSDGHLSKFINHYNDVNNEEVNEILKREGQKIWTSFNLYRDIIAARVPAQSMQSFMPMQIELFENEDVNNAFVSSMLIWLQGSDYDIDTVNLVTYSINKKGIAELWSPYARQTIHLGENPLLNLQDSMRYLPFPSGKSVEIVKSNFTTVKDFLTKYAPLFNIFYYTAPADKNSPILTRKIDISLKDNYDIKLLGEFLNESAVPALSVLDTYQMISYLKDRNSINPIEGESTDAFLQRVASYNELVNAFQSDTIDKDTLRNLLSSNTLDNVYKEFQEIINKHNLYFNNIKNREKAVLISTNYLLYNMYTIGADPANLMQSQAAVDEVTKPAKEKAKEASVFENMDEKTIHNFIVKYLGINNNAVGKQCIGINAIGLKSYFNLTLYFNTILNRKYDSTEEAIKNQEYLLFPGTGGIRIGGKNYHLLSNVRAKDPNTVISNKVLEKLVLLQIDHDVALDKSALISLSADNAKELTLARLRINPKTNGMYVAGLMIGMDFNDIADLFMGDVGKIILNLAESDIFNGKRDISSSNMDRIFDKLDLDGNLQLPKIYVNGLDLVLQAFEELMASIDEKIVKPENSRQYNFKKSYELYKAGDKKLQAIIKEILFPEYGYLYNTLTANGIVNNGILILNNVVLNIENKLALSLEKESIKAYQYRSIAEFKEAIYYKLICNINITLPGKKFSNKQQLTDIKTLYKIGLELFTLGRISSLNQGLKSKEDEINTVLDIFKDLNIDLVRFVDETSRGEAYREECIAKYNKIKTAFNIPHMIINVPHLFLYVKILAMSLEGMNNSLLFRFTRQETDKVIEHFYIDLVLLEKMKSKPTELDKKDYKNRLSVSRKDTRRLLKSFYYDYIQNLWLLNKRFILPAGERMFEIENGKLVLSAPTTQDITILLGDELSNATFRRYVENNVIPGLKAGEVWKVSGKKARVVNDANVQNNLFIQDLTTRPFDKTLMGNPSIVYTLPINMSPKSGSYEQLVLLDAQDSFKELAQYFSKVDVQYRIGEEGKEWGGVQKLPILELMFYYAMISQNKRLGEAALIRIFTSNTPQMDEFSLFQKNLDNSKLTPTFGKDIPWEMYTPFSIKKGNKYSSGDEYILDRDVRTRVKRVWKRNPNSIFSTEDMDFYLDLMSELEIEDDLSTKLGGAELRYSIVNMSTVNLNLIDVPDSLLRYFYKGAAYKEGVLNLSKQDTNGLGQLDIKYDIKSKIVTEVKSVHDADKLNKALKGWKLPFKLVFNSREGGILYVLDEKALLNKLKEVDNDNLLCS